MKFNLYAILFSVLFIACAADTVKSGINDQVQGFVLALFGKYPVEGGCEAFYSQVDAQNEAEPADVTEATALDCQTYQTAVSCYKANNNNNEPDASVLSQENANAIQALCSQ